MIRRVILFRKLSKGSFFWKIRQVELGDMDKILNLSGGKFFADPVFRLSVAPPHSEHRDRNGVNYT